mmetsp:Transcript_46693/g.69032  ORF Transcript_46693/g.69032 Transcript_46693/m.69032 type:complete len:397 (+) Transcript_46693:227-1417(+)|eukprot:CAMPEP_0195527978 /NCGR_PEP_ID=MMETSP0794_2-20130614/29929_1 /TAXON_ID=515487 /ORGANISM="Stephanopyxis turris, Strain CCMP 815" /LENGTH=396 /DNA_ID=CAMNT_0040659007 /DNA_START=218 /DNA_END=1408 /DNA_ORIENTATION=+
MKVSLCASILSRRNLFATSSSSSLVKTAATAVSSKEVRDFDPLPKSLSRLSKSYLHSESDGSEEKILVTGASGQVGQELVPFLQSEYGGKNVIASDLCSATNLDNKSSSGMSIRHVDVLNPEDLSEIVRNENINTIVHLAAVLSAKGELNPQMALKVNNEGTQNVLEIAREENLKVFCPSSIATFGPTSPKSNTPDDCILQPTTMYGITKVHTELLGEYYHKMYGVDFRCLRYPGVISTKAKPGFGTTDYAVEIFREAIRTWQYTCYLKKDTTLPMIYMPDLLKGTKELLQADPTILKRRTYNLGAMSFTPHQLACSIERVIPDFHVGYEPDFRQAIADSWPSSIDYSCAINDWGWSPDFKDVDAMTVDILGQYAEDLKERESPLWEQHAADAVLL